MSAEELQREIENIADAARSAATLLASMTAERRTDILHAAADALVASRNAILSANEKDVAAAVTSGRSAAIVDRLTLNDARLEQIIESLHHVADLPDSLGEVLEEKQRPNGLRIVKKRVPIGVIGMIFESRPNVAADSAALCIKTGNAVILRGGSEAAFSNQALVQAICAGGGTRGLPQGSVQLIENPDRNAVRVLARLEGKVDLLIPRGGENLIRAVTEVARVPVIKHYKGVCHIYVDHSADMTQACAIIENAKCQRPGVCNAVETVLVHEQIAAAFLPRLHECLSARGVELRADEQARQYLSSALEASEQDWFEEYLDLILAIRVVPDTAAAIDHINRYGSHHSDSILTADKDSAARFLNEVDSAVVYENASTRFTDGGEFGLGAEIGISTDKLHARGPMGPAELTTYKYLVYGNGQIRR
jgi:glutamate-5-semialdehyde dehydrogenase